MSRGENTRKRIRELLGYADDGFLGEDEVIRTEGLTKCFGDFTAVDHISFSVNKGEIFGFLGANGAGKTTAMKMLCGLSKPTDGRAVVAGYDLHFNSDVKRLKKVIGYMSQKFSLYENLRVWENIRLFGGIYGMKDRDIAEKTDELLQRLDLTEQRNRMVRDLPLGWKQKLAFSVAIFHEPRIVFLDEPTGGVDPTVFVTTHYMDEAEYCNRVSIMVDGRIEALDSPAALKQRYGASGMDEVFRMLAGRAKREE